MEKLKIKNTIITFEHFDEKIDGIDPNKVYYSSFFLEDELKEYQIKPNSVIKITSKEINSSNECFIICVGILRTSSRNFLPIKYIKDNDKLVIGFETFVLS